MALAVTFAGVLVGAGTGVAARADVACPPDSLCFYEDRDFGGYMILEEHVQRRLLPVPQHQLQREYVLPILGQLRGRVVPTPHGLDEVTRARTILAAIEHRHQQTLGTKDYTTFKTTLRQITHLQRQWRDARGTN